ncbi:MAG: hypothetical protein KA195_06670 [Burkholderiaceae bacterium]|nr:hypothetical protein [Burkholderiaceae bacterium]
MPTHAPEASADYITLHGTHTSVVLEVRPHEAPLWRYWGLSCPPFFVFQGSMVSIET